MILLLIVISVAVREILGREVANLGQMAKITVYNVELTELFYVNMHYYSLCSGMFARYLVF